jgi:two-component system, sensor histidine kinase LadS
MKIGLLMFLIIFINCNSYAFSYILLDEAQPDGIISANYIEIFEDSSQVYSISDVSSPAFNAKFYINKNRISNIKNANITYWVRFKLKYARLNNKRWLLEILDLHVDRVHVYIKTSSALMSLGHTGYKLPFLQRDYLHKNFVFDIPEINFNEEFTIYVQMRSQTFNPFLFKLRTQNYFLAYALNEYYILGLYYGILLIMAIYNTMLFLYIREQMYLYYVMYVLSCMLVSFSEDGLGFQYIWFHYPYFNLIAEDFGYFIFLFFFTIYAQAFLEFNKYLPKINQALNLILFVYFIYFAFSFLFQTYTPFHFNLLIIPFLLIYIGSWQVYLKGNRTYSSFFVLGYSITMIGIFSAIFRKNGLLTSDNILYVYSLNIGFMVEVIFFSLALAYRLRTIKQKNETTQISLIQQLQENEKTIVQKVIERTEKIAQQKFEIFEKNQQLEAQATVLQQQAEEIKRMNALLNQENEALQTSVHELTKARVMMQEVDFEEFKRIFPDEATCYKYLAELKWKEGFNCIKCNNDKSLEGQGHFARRCTRCGYNESSTVNTIFHRNHIPIVKALYLLFLVYASQGKVSVTELSKTLELRENTCRKFNKKVKDKIHLIKTSIIPQNLDSWSQLILDKIS